MREYMQCTVHVHVFAGIYTWQQLAAARSLLPKVLDGSAVVLALVDRLRDE